MERQIVCYQIPSFEVALARLENPSLKTWPVGVAPHTPRACVQEISGEAYHDGVRAGMPVDVAMRLCPLLRLLPPDPLRVRLGHQQLQDIVARFAPVWEPVRPGHLFLDLTGRRRLFGAAVDTAARIEQEIIARYRLAGVAGVGSNKLVSSVAARLVQPSQLCDVRAGSEETFLAPLPATLLPRLPPVHAKTITMLLDDLNLQTMGEIAEISLPHLELALGPPAGLVHDWARGIDASPVLPTVQHHRLDVSIAVNPDEVHDDRLLGVLYGLLERLCRELRRQQRLCQRLMLTLLHTDRVEVSKTQTFNPDTYWEGEMYPYLKELFFRCFKRRVRIHRLSLTAEGLGLPDVQLSLFDMEMPQQTQRDRTRRLSLALDRVRDRFGEQVVCRGAYKA